MRVLLVDDHALFRRGLEELLDRRGIEVLAAVGSGEEGVRLAMDRTPDVVLLDMRMPGVGGLDVLRRLKEAGFPSPVVMLTTSTDEADLIASLRNGAQGYLLKDMEPDELVRALHEILAGRTVVTPEFTAALANAVKGGKETVEKEAPFADLTPREREILCHLAEGQSNKVIAQNLGISDGTVKLHVKAILRKLSVHSRVEAAVMAVERGLCHKTDQQRFLVGSQKHGNTG